MQYLRADFDTRRLLITHFIIFVSRTSRLAHGKCQFASPLYRRPPHALRIDFFDMRVDKYFS
jgi:hypothetical protein